MIVVLDTNVWVSALEFGGTPGEALLKALTRDQLAISQYIVDEIRKVMTRKFGRDTTELQSTMAELLPAALWVEVIGKVSGICRDPNDDPIIETAWKAGADYLVAGDKDLLSLGRFGDTLIIPPGEYVRNR